MTRKSKINWERCSSQALNSLNTGNFKKAIFYYQKLIKNRLATPKIYNNLALAYENLRDYLQAEKFFKKALKIDPQFSAVYNNLGNLYHLTGKLKLAIKYLKKAIKINPNFFQVYYNLGLVYYTLFQYQKALFYLKKSTTLNPQYGSAYSVIGSILKEQGKIKESLAYFSRTLDFLTDDIAYYNLGVVLHELNQPEQALSYFQHAYQLNPDNQENLAQLINQKRDLADWKDLSLLIKKIDQQTKKALKKNQKTGETPFLSVYLFENQKRNFQVAQIWSQQIKNKVKPFGRVFESKPLNLYRKKIRIGYLSGDFYDHATYHLIKDLFKFYNRDKFETYIYSYGKSDHYTKEVKKLVDGFTDVTHLSFFDLAKKIYQDKIDILVDLKGHTKDNRLEVFALRPAPVQIHFLGFPGSIAGDFIDYFIADKTVIPDSHLKYFAEKIIYLPGSYQINSRQEIIKKKFTRKDFRLPEDGFVFCSFNQSYKISEEVFSLWLSILKETPKSVLWLLDGRETYKTNLLTYAKSQGVNPKRIIFAPFLPKNYHLKRLSLADLVLDTFPYNGHTSTSDALWAGVPVITILGRHFASRVSASLLKTFGINELIVKDKNHYKKLAINLAKNPKKYLLLRKKMVEKQKDNPLFNVENFIKNLEKAYETIWNSYLKKRIELVEKITTPPKKTQKKLWSENSVVFFAGPQISPWDINLFQKELPRYIQNNERVFIELIFELKKLNWQVTVFTQVKKEGVCQGINWKNFYRFNPNDEFNILVFFQNPNFIKESLKAKKIYLWFPESINFKSLTEKKINQLTKIVLSSFAQRNLFVNLEDDKFFISPFTFKEICQKKQIENNPFWCLYPAALDKGFEHFASIWPPVIKEIPQAKLYITPKSSFSDILNINQQSYLLWKRKIDKIFRLPGVFYLPNLSQEEIETWYKKCGLFLYPCHDYEMTAALAIEAQAYGCLPITTSVGALEEVVNFGIKIPGSIKDKKNLALYTQGLILALKNEKWQRKEREEMISWARQNFSGANIALKWDKEFKKQASG